MQRLDAAYPIDRRVVLVGAGNAHLLFVRRWGMRPIPGVAVTLVNDGPTIPYSAMVPGCIAGDYDRDEVTIDLVKLCPTLGVRLVPEPVVRIDPAARKIQFAGRPALGYDILSLGLGSLPLPPPGAETLEWSFSLRPLGKLLDRLNCLEDRVRTANRPFRFAVVGGGASGCELALAIHKRFAKWNVAVSLLHAGPRLMENFPVRASRLVEDACRARGIDVRINTRVTGAMTGSLRLDGGEAIPCEGVLWATDPSPPAVLKESGLALDDNGYLLVRTTLQTRDDPAVYGTGDCVAFPAYPNLPRNGVMAVRQGEVLYHNIAAALEGGRSRVFRPQKRWLSLVNTADGAAVASYGPTATSGRWLRRWKDRIDRRWMRMISPPPPKLDDAALDVPAMRCGGCGSKVPGDVLAAAVARLDVYDDSRVLIGCQAGEDAAVFQTGPDEKVEVQTVDYFKSFVDDPYLFGRVAALHAVSDLYAMNARPFAALAIATVPQSRAWVQTEMLGELLAGAARELKQMGIVLAGGHTTEGPELALGFSVTGHAYAERLFHKGGLRPGDALVLTKPLGTGALLACVDARAVPGGLVRSGGPIHAPLEPVGGGNLCGERGPRLHRRHRLRTGRSPAGNAGQEWRLGRARQ